MQVEAHTNATSKGKHTQNVTPVKLKRMTKPHLSHDYIVVHGLRALESPPQVAAGTPYGHVIRILERP